MKIFQILAIVSDHPPVSQITIFLICQKKYVHFTWFLKGMCQILSCLNAHCQRNKLSLEKLFWREEDRLVPVPGVSLFEVKAAPILHWWTFRKASSHLGVFAVLHSGWSFCWSQRWLASSFHNTEIEQTIFQCMKIYFYCIWQRWVYIFIQV